MGVSRTALEHDRWRAPDPAAQERVIGRDRDTGAPFGGRREFDPPVLERMPADAHSRLAAPRSKRGAAMLRRSWSYEEDGEAGLLFTAYAQDPARQVVPVARRLAAVDALRAFSRTTARRCSRCRRRGFVGEGLISPGRPAAS